MRILSLKMKDFKGTPQAEYRFGEVNKIFGENFAGKTTIAEAIMFALFGVNLEGSNRTANLIRQGAKKCLVSVSVDIDGVAHSIEREATSSQKIVYLDGEETTQAKVEQYVGPMDRFLASFIPTYVLSLSDNDARKFFMSLLLRIESSEVLASLDDPYQEILAGIDLVNPELRKKELREEISEEEKAQQWAEGAIDTYSKALNEVPPKFVETEGLKQKLAAVEKQLFELNDNKPTLIDTAPLEKEIYEFQRQLNSVLLDQPKQHPTNEIESQMAVLRGEYKALEKEIASLKVEFQVGDQCPTCSQSIGEEAFLRFSHVVENLKSELSSKLDNLVVEGKGLRAQLEVVKSSNELALETFEKKQAETKVKIETELLQLQEKLEQARSRNRYIETEWQKTTAQKLAELRHEHMELSAKLLEAERSNTERSAILARIEQAQVEIAKLKADLPRSEKAIKDAKQKIEVINLYIAKHAEMLAKQIEQYFDRASIQLFDIVKSTGEMKPVFKLLYDNKPISILSMSERIRLGLEVAEAVKRLSGVQYPTFLDNAESITHYNSPYGQLFTATVIQGQPKLNMEVA